MYSKGNSLSFYAIHPSFVFSIYALFCSFSLFLFAFFFFCFWFSPLQLTSDKLLCEGIAGMDSSDIHHMLSADEVRTRGYR